LRELLMMASPRPDAYSVAYDTDRLASLRVRVRV